MAAFVAVASGNLTAAATWQQVNATGFADYESASQFGDATFRGAGAFTPGAIQIDGIILKLYNRNAAPAGTFSVRLYNNTDAAAVAGTTVTINVTDLPAPLAVVIKGNIGWCYFKFAAPVTLIAGKAYIVQTSQSTSGQVYFYYSGVNYTYATGLVLTGVPGAAPTTGDQLIVCGTRTGAGVNTAVAVTMDQTSSAVIYGTTSGSVASIQISQGGTVAFGYAAATNYYWNLKGYLWISTGGTLNVGTVANPIPRDSTATLNFNITGGANQYWIHNQGTMTTQGLSRTLGKNVVGCLLTVKHTAGGSSFTVDRDTGWKSGDGVIIGGTTRTSARAESKVLNGDAGATSFTITGTSSYDHDGVGVQAAVVSTYRNVVIQTESGKVSYIFLDVDSVLDADWTKFYRMGGNSINKGVQYYRPAGMNFDYCLFQPDTSGTAYGVSAYATSGNCFPPLATTWTFNVGIGFNDYLFDFQGSSAQFDQWDRTITDSWSVGNPTYGQNGFLSDKSIGRNLTVLRCQIHDSYSGNPNVYFGSGDTYATSGKPKLRTFQDCVWQGGTYMIQWAGVNDGYAYFKNCKFQRSKSGGGNAYMVYYGGSPRSILWEDCEFQGGQHSAAWIEPTRDMQDVIYRNCKFGGEAAYSQVAAMTMGASGGSGIHYQMRFEGCLFGDAAGGTFTDHTTADFNHASVGFQNMDWAFVNCVTGTPTQFTAAVIAAADYRSKFRFQRENGVAGSHRTYYPALGVVARDGTFFRSSAPSEKISPTGATADFRLYSAPKRFDVSTGSQKSPAVYVYLDPAYNGLAPRLIMKANNAIGQDTDAVLATHSGSTGVWEKLIGTMPVAAEDDGQVELVIDCTGTAGYVWIDDWSV